MLKEKIRSVHFWLVVVSITLYILSLFFTPFYVANEKNDIFSNSLFVVLIGWIAVLGGGLIPSIIWLANPLYFYAVFFTFFKSKFGIVPVSISIILAVYFTTLNSIMDGESGAMTKITELGAGFYFWIASFIVLFFAGLNLFVKSNKS